MKKRTTTASSRASNVANTLTIRGKEVPVSIELVDQRKLRFFSDNPRIYSIVRANGKDPSQEEIQKQLMQLDHVRDLILDIRKNNGLTDPLVVIDKSFEVVEGNSRLAAYRQLAKKEPLRWSKVKCMLLPADIDHGLLFTLLGQYHIKGKKDWLPYEQAGFLYRRFSEYEVDLKTLAEEIGLSLRKVRHLIETYKFMVDYGETETERWSYYDEYLKSSKIRKAREAHHGLDRLIVAKINSGDIGKAVELRDRLPVICGNASVLGRFAAGTIKFEEAHEEALAGGGGSPQLKKITTFRQWLTSEKVDPMLNTKGPTRKHILFELKKIASRVEALRSKLQAKS